MRSLILSMVLATSVAAQTTKTPVTGDGPLILHVRAVDVSKLASMHITMRGDLFSSLGVEKPYPGTLHLEGRTGTASGVIFGELTAHAGQIQFTSDSPLMQLELSVQPRSGASTPRMVARGISVRVVRSEAGMVSVESVP